MPEQWHSLDLRVTEDPPHSRESWRSYWDVVGLPAQRELRVLSSAGGWPEVPEGAPGRSIRLMDVTLQAHWVGDELWLGRELYLKVGAERSELHLDPAHATTTALMLALTEVQRAGGWLPLHASVVARGGRAVAVTGVSGAGKSTALLRLAGAGFEVIAEDRAFWHAPSGRAVGLDRYLRAFTDSLERFAPDWVPRLPLPQDVKGKWLLPLSAFAPAAAAQLTGVLLLKKQDAAELSGPERVRAVWELTGWPLTARATAQVQRGVTGLLPLVAPRQVSRDTVMGAVTALLGSES